MNDRDSLLIADKAHEKSKRTISKKTEKKYGGLGYYQTDECILLFSKSYCTYIYIRRAVMSVYLRTQNSLFIKLFEFYKD